jgi:hypothetical protein
MRRIPLIAAAVALTLVHTRCYARCNCDDWMGRGGYCVDYVKTRIPTFPIPKTDAEIAALKNRETTQVEEGDVAIFDLGNYWHVAYVEKVHLDRQGAATSIDVSEMNFGGNMSFQEYRNNWKQKNASEWKRALCCGVTKNYDQTGRRKNIALDSVEQIWSPDTLAPQEARAGQRDDRLIDKAREAFNRFIQFTGREL